MAMTYLQLCQRLVQEAGIAGEGPTTTIGQTQKLKKAVSWIQQSWIEIQLMRPNWNFMWEEFTFPTIAEQRDYAPASLAAPIIDLHNWYTDTFLIYETALGTSEEGNLEFRTYDRWRREYRNGMASRDSNQPVVVTVLPNKSVRLEPKPDKIYTVSGEYKRTAQTMTADADLPTGLPDDFHLIIVWQALKKYASFEDAPEVMDEAETNFDDLLFRLENLELPEMSEVYETLA